MRVIRHWSVRHARGLMRLYRVLESGLRWSRPMIRLIGERRLERPTAAVERGIKGLLFDCQMCGQCALSHTGMSCPMNCPKSLRNGPCGGVRANGNCEVVPDMPCVWVEAWRGAEAMRSPETMLAVHRPVDNSRQGRSSWLRVAKEDDSGTIWVSAEKPSDTPSSKDAAV